MAKKSSKTKSKDLVVTSSTDWTKVLIYLIVFSFLSFTIYMYYTYDPSVTGKVVYSDNINNAGNSGSTDYISSKDINTDSYTLRYSDSSEDSSYNTVTVKERSISGVNNEVTVSDSSPLFLYISGVRNVITIDYGTVVKKIVVSGVDNTIYIPKNQNPTVEDSGVDTTIVYY